MLEALPQRRAHLLAAGSKAEEVAGVLDDEDRGVLIAAAYLHDVGYAPALVRTGAHQLDGGRWLSSLGLHRLAALVAHHSGARFEMELRGLNHLLVDFGREAGEIDDALTYCDLTTGPQGDDVSAVERLAEVRCRYAPDSVVVRALDAAEPELLAAVARTQARLVQSKVAAEGSAK